MARSDAADVASLFGGVGGGGGGLGVGAVVEGRTGQGSVLDLGIGVRLWRRQDGPKAEHGNNNNALDSNT